jgi:hypothetical protein
VPSLSFVQAEHSIGERLVDHVSAKGPVITAFRGTLLAVAIERLKQCGHYERYEAMLPPAQREAILCSLAMSWIPIELISAHSDTCEQLNLSDAELIELGGQAANSIVRSLFSSLLRASGTSPWVAIKAADRMWDRLHEGGGIMVVRTGPKDVYVEQHGHPLAGSRYYRTTARGFYKSLAELFSSKVYVKAAPPRHPGKLAFALEVSWV